MGALYAMQGNRVVKGGYSSPVYTHIAHRVNTFLLYT